MAALSPSRAQPNAIFAEDPPRYFAKVDTSSSRAPTCCAYRSTARRPRQMMSRLRPAAKRVPAGAVEVLVRAINYPECRDVGAASAIAKTIAIAKGCQLASIRARVRFAWTWASDRRAF